MAGIQDQAIGKPDSLEGKVIEIKSQEDLLHVLNSLDLNNTEGVYLLIVPEGGLKKTPGIHIANRSKCSCPSNEACSDCDVDHNSSSSCCNRDTCPSSCHNAACYGSPGSYSFNRCYTR
jgi:hypothetical protein